VSTSVSDKQRMNVDTKPEVRKYGLKIRGLATPYYSQIN